MNDVAHSNVCCGVFKEAWQKVKGVKGSYWGSATLISLVVFGGFGMLGLMFLMLQVAHLPHFIALFKQTPAFFMDPNFVLPASIVVSLVFYHIAQFLFKIFMILPMSMGLRLIILRHAAGKPIRAVYGFEFLHWKFIWRFILLGVLMVLMIGIPIALGLLCFQAVHAFQLVMYAKWVAIVVGILFFLLSLYLFVSYAFVNFGIIDRTETSAWQVMEISRKAISKKWFCMFGTLIWLGIVMLIGTLLLGIGLIWAIPYAQNVVAILYRNMAGIEGHDPVTLSGN